MKTFIVNTKLLIIITLALLKIRPVKCVQSSSISSIPALLNGNICLHTAVQMTCIVTDLTSLRWFISGTPPLTPYVYLHLDVFPYTLRRTPPGLEMTITSGTRHSINPDLFSATSILTTDTTHLQAFNMKNFSCGTVGVPSEQVNVNFDIMGPPLSPIATCSLVTSANSFVALRLQWSSSFNSQHAVERYRVSVDPDPSSSSCSSDQVIPSEDYSCPGLSPERSYSITVSAINCGDQEGESETFAVVVPRSRSVPRITSSGNVLPVFTPSGELDEITVLWEHIDQSVTPGDCPFSSDVNYTVILEEHGTGNVQKIINSNTCVRSECNASFDAPLNRSVIVKITATNEIGESPTIVIDNTQNASLEDLEVDGSNTTVTGSSQSPAISTTCTVAVGAFIFFHIMQYAIG